MYLDHDSFKDRSLIWDEKEELMMIEYRKTKEYMDRKFELMPIVNDWASLEDAANTTALIPSEDLDRIDEMEKVWQEEFSRVMEKDKELGKEFNM